MFPQAGRYENGVYVASGTDRRMDAVVVDKGNRVSDAIRVGATVVADRKSGVILVVDGVEYRLVPEKEILGERDL